MKSVAELHAQYPYDRSERWWSYNTSLEESIAMAENLHEQPDMVAYLDSMLNDIHTEGDSDGYTRAKAICRALLFLPPEVVYENFGHELAVWASVNTPIMGESDGVNKVLTDRGGYDTDDLEISRLWQWNNHHNSHGKPILSNYQLMQSIKNGALDNIDLPNLLETNAKPDINLSQKRLADYALLPVELEEDGYNTLLKGGWTREWTRRVAGDIRYDIWMDAPIGIILAYKGLPNAIAGLAMRGTDEIMMYQVQGIRGKRIDPSKSAYDDNYVKGEAKSRGLMPIDWQKLLVEVTGAIGENAGARNIGIQAGKNNVWAKGDEGDDHYLSPDNAERCYDTPAKRLGFTKHPSDQEDNWHKAIV